MTSDSVRRDVYKEGGLEIENLQFQGQTLLPFFSLFCYLNLQIQKPKDGAKESLSNVCYIFSASVKFLYKQLQDRSKFYTNDATLIPN